MAVTLREVVDYLRGRGVNITFRERPDGSLRITSIDGIRYAGSEGNNKAREEAGMEMSAAQKEQRRKAQPKAVEGTKLKEEPSLTTKERERLRIENKKRRKVGLEGLTAKQARRAKKDDGNLRAMLKRSANARIHAAGYAYRASIQRDIDEIENDRILKEKRSGVFVPAGVKFPKTLRALRAGLNGKITISDEALYRCREIRYEFEPGATISKDGTKTIEQADIEMEDILRKSWQDIKD